LTRPLILERPHLTISVRPLHARRIVFANLTAKAEHQWAKWRPKFQSLKVSKLFNLLNAQPHVTRLPSIIRGKLMMVRGKGTFARLRPPAASSCEDGLGGVSFGGSEAWKWLLNHTKSNNPVPRLSRHTVPTNLTPQPESTIVESSGSSTAQLWWDDTRQTPARVLLFRALRISDESACLIQMRASPSPLGSRKLPKRSVPRRRYGQAGDPCQQHPCHLETTETRSPERK
jgi:hypothetical protein